ncbi:membrane protein [Beggiatoa sp. PS]|nr:membrane protein [Beggiatoa sp. PS]
MTQSVMKGIPNVDVGNEKIILNAGLGLAGITCLPTCPCYMSSMLTNGVQIVTETLGIILANFMNFLKNCIFDHFIPPKVLVVYILLVVHNLLPE